MHNILKEQISKYLGETHELTLELQAFLNAVNTEYIKATNEKERLESLKKQEALNKLNSFRGAIEEATMVVHLDPKGKLIFVNKNFCDLSGYASEEICGKRITDILSLYNTQKIKKIVQQLQKGASWKGELSFIGRYNQKIWLQSTVVTVKDYNGNLEGYMAILNDITARKIFEEEIVNSEKKYKHVVNSIKEIIFQTDISGDWTFLNKAWTEITEYNVLESVGLNHIDFVHEEDKKRVAECFQMLIAEKNEISYCILRIKTKTGNYKTCDLFARTIHDENSQLIGITGTINDVTEKRRNEELLTKSYAFQRAILDSAKQAIISTDHNGIIRTFNLGAEQILGYSQEKLINQKNIDILFDPEIIKKHQHLHPENTEKNTNVWFTGLLHESTGDSAEEREQLFISEDRKIIPVMLSLTAIRDHLGEVSGYLFIANDVTQRKKAETENYKLNKILEETPDYVVYYDLDNRPLYSNKAYKEIRFDKKEEETKQPLHPAWAEIIIRKKAIPFAMDNGSWKGETAILNKEGVEIPVGIILGEGSTGSIFNNLIKDGEGSGILDNGLGDIKIYNNIILNPGKNNEKPSSNYGIYIDDKSSFPQMYFSVYNNLILNPRKEGVRMLSNLSSNKNSISNNIIIKSGLIASTTNPDEDYILSIGNPVIKNSNFCSSSLDQLFFMDVLHDNFNLQSVSPVIDAGSKIIYSEFTEDYYSQPREQGNGLDIGPVESKYTKNTNYLDSTQLISEIVYPNPIEEEEYFTIEFSNDLPALIKFNLVDQLGAIKKQLGSQYFINGNHQISFESKQLEIGLNLIQISKARKSKLIRVVKKESSK